MPHATTVHTRGVCSPPPNARVNGAGTHTASCNSLHRFQVCHAYTEVDAEAEAVDLAQTRWVVDALDDSSDGVYSKHTVFHTVAHTLVASSVCICVAISGNTATCSEIATGAQGSYALTELPVPLRHVWVPHTSSVFIWAAHARTDASGGVLPDLLRPVAIEHVNSILSACWPDARTFTAQSGTASTGWVEPAAFTGCSHGSVTASLHAMLTARKKRVASALQHTIEAEDDASSVSSEGSAQEDDDEDADQDGDEDDGDEKRDDDEVDNDEGHTASISLHGGVDDNDTDANDDDDDDDDAEDDDEHADDSENEI